MYFGSLFGSVLWQERHSGRSLRQLVTFHLQPGSRERNGCWSSVHLLFIQCGTLAPKTAICKFRVGLSPQINISEQSFIVTPTDVSSG